MPRRRLRYGGGTPSSLKGLYTHTKTGFEEKRKPNPINYPIAYDRHENLMPKKKNETKSDDVGSRWVKMG